MQSLCFLAIPQFHVFTTLFCFVYYILSVENQSEELASYFLSGLQLLVGLIVLGLVFARPKHKVRKIYILCFVCLFVAIQVYLLVENFRRENCLVLFILEFFSIEMIFSLVILPNKLIGIVLQVQVYLIAICLDLMSFYIYYYMDKFNLNRSISILGSSVIEMITLILCIVCQLNPQKRLADEVHLIIGFYIFCELFVCCTFVAECVSQGVNAFLIGLTILKISNIFLDFILYPFVKLNYPENQIKPGRVDIENPPQKSELRSVATRETLSDDQNSLKKDAEEPVRIERKACPSIQWIQDLLKIY
ncbi:unnamed protein product (macronuclear) [Paramecium tetraurelia]|uniref:Uncharacterized protein n=1 Tax=Paramecium tetraurelia TaxID=5888 RepID=A0CEN7_PARTE|nr:uncharacterized protein GSPATT00037693001 [Paramecium tetraurelia]CAK69254.1 unnamed protein product [Paramecium tetraurelia]|eukprot:XP_001436651.1 hypothetical protein (macronuclear) [Paramecium tetraurelia strain d4-2]